MHWQTLRGVTVRRHTLPRSALIREYPDAIRRPVARQHRLLRDAGSTASGFLVAILVLAAIGVAAFFYFGGEADVDIKKPDVTVTSDETPERR